MRVPGRCEPCQWLRYVLCFSFPLFQPDMNGFALCPDLEPVYSPMPDSNFVISWIASNDSVAAQQALLEKITCVKRRASPVSLSTTKASLRFPAS